MNYFLLFTSIRVSDIRKWNKSSEEHSVSLREGCTIEPFSVLIISWKVGVALNQPLVSRASIEFLNSWYCDIARSDSLLRNFLNKCVHVRINISLLWNLFYMYGRFPSIRSVIEASAEVSAAFSLEISDRDRCETIGCSCADLVNLFARRNFAAQAAKLPPFNPALLSFRRLCFAFDVTMPCDEIFPSRIRVVNCSGRRCFDASVNLLYSIYSFYTRTFAKTFAQHAVILRYREKPISFRFY